MRVACACLLACATLHGSAAFTTSFLPASRSLELAKHGQIPASASTLNRAMNLRGQRKTARQTSTPVAVAEFASPIADAIQVCMGRFKTITLSLFRFNSEKLSVFQENHMQRNERQIIAE
jgi:hypothetical protein